MESASGNNPEETRFPEAVLLAGASAISYAVAYAYRTGFASYYGLPPVLLTPTIGGILQAGAGVGAILLTLSLFLNSFWMFLPSRESALGRSIRRVFLMLVVTILTSYSLFVYRWGWLAVPAALCVFGFLELVFPLLTQRKIARYEDKLAAQEKVESKVTTPADHLAKRIGKKAFLLVLAAYILINFSHSVGYRAAKEQEEFFVLDDTPGYVVAMMDDDIVVLVAYDPESSTLKRSYDVRRLSSSQASWRLRKKKIGRLNGPPAADKPTREDLCPECI